MSTHMCTSSPISPHTSHYPRMETVCRLCAASESWPSRQAVSVLLGGGMHHSHVSTWLASPFSLLPGCPYLNVVPLKPVTCRRGKHTGAAPERTAWNPGL